MELTKNTNLSPSSITWALVAGGGVVLIIAGMRATSQIVNMLLLAYVITLLFTPFFIWLRRKRIPSLLAIFAIMLTLLVFALAFVWFVGISVTQFEAKLPEYEAQLEASLRNFIPLEALPQVADNLSEIQIGEFLSFGSLASSALKVVPSLLSGLSNFTSQALMIAFIVFFGLLESSNLAKRVAMGLGTNTGLLNDLQDINSGVRKYIIIKTWTGLLAAGANTVVLMMLGVDFALLWGLISFLLNYIPSIGFIIAFIPPFLLALVQFGLGKALIVLVAYLIINTITDNIISPRVMGRGLDLSPLAVFISLVFWAWVLGLVGAIMAVPLLLIMKMFFRRFDDTRWLAVAISGDDQAAQN
jgi:predicted PurR-regulated permease PerM